jgi:3',5'-cyclic AMP phosphodiesterase CpdA
VSNGSPPFLLAHVSDLHATTVTPDRLSELAGKRLLGWLSWRRRRRYEHRDFVLEALLDDLSVSGAEHVAVSGDLTHVGLASEIADAAGWLRRIGPADRVSLVPGNHDAYGPSAAADPWSAWAPYMTSLAADGLDVAGGNDRFPFARRVGPIAIIGVSSARPTAAWLATGLLGDAQRARLESILWKLRAEGRFRVLLIHHPPVPAGQSRRRQLDDAPELRALLARTGTELVLHGHTHRTSIERIDGPDGAIPVVGVPSASSVGPSEARRARYHVYRIERDESRRFRVSYQVRGFDPATRRFAPEAEAPL